MRPIKNIINIDNEILGGQPVFMETKTSIEIFFNHLEKVIALDEFLEDFPTVKNDQAITLLEIAEKLCPSKNISKIYESVA